MKNLKLALFAFATMAIISCKKENTTENVTQEGTEIASVDNKEASVKVKEENAETVTVDPATAPILELDAETYDFGDVQAGSKNEKVIVFQNTGKGPLQIKNAKGSCGCTVPEWDKEPIAPGENGELKVAYTAPKTNGKQTKTVTLTTNTVKGSERFKITANVVGGTDKPAPKPQPAKQSQPLPAPKLEQAN